MPETTTFKEVRAKLRQARRLVVVCRVAQAIVGAGVVLLALQSITAMVWYLVHPASFAGYPKTLPAILVVSIVISAIAAVYLARRARRLAQIATQAEEAFPELGLRLTTSLEAPEMGYCPPSIRQALWRDTLEKIEKVQWRRFASRLSALVWLALAILLLAAQVTVNVPSLRRKAVQAATGAPTTAPTTKPATKPAPPPIPFHATLELLAPEADLWATKIENIPVKVRADSTHGLNHTRLIAIIGGGEPTTFVIGEAKSLVPGTQVVPTDLNLDELPLQDFDTVACNVAADTVRPDGTKITVESGIFFVQIRPFRKDVRSVPGGGGGTRQQQYVIRWLIEAEKKIIRDTSTLRSLTDANSPKARTTHDSAMEAQQVAIDKTLALASGTLEDAADRIGPHERSVLNDAAGTMYEVVDDLKASRYADAVAREQKVTAMLVSLLRNEREIRPENARRGGTPPRKVGPKEPSPPPSDQRLTELQKLAELQERLNASVRGLLQNRKALTDAQYQQELQDLLSRQQAITDTTQKYVGSGPYSEPIKGILTQAKGLMEENASAFKAAHNQITDELSITAPATAPAKPGDKP